MNARFRFSIVALCFAGALAGCGSVTTGTAFQPPAGWNGTPALFGRAQVWFKQGQDKNTSQFLVLIKGDAKTTHSDFNEVPPQYSKTTNVIQQGKIKMCGSQPGQQMIAEGTDKDGHKNRIEMTSTVIGADRYVAMYIRPVAVAADTQAESAIHSLCPMKP
jgi:hypothetical protein